MDPEEFADLVVDYTKQVLAGPRVDGRFAALEARIARLEAKPSVKFRGVYEAGKDYAPGDACTYSGGLWICRAPTTGQPNQDFAGWTLAVKSRSVV